MIYIPLHIETLLKIHIMKKFANAQYFALNINERINLRQYRNALFFNSLFRTCVVNYSSGDFRTEYPANNQAKIYHHYGKNHSKYPKK